MKSSFPDELFETTDFSDVQAYARLVENLNRLPVLKPFLPRAEYEALDLFAVKADEPLACNGRRFKHQWMYGKGGYLKNFGYVLPTLDLMNSLVSLLAGTGRVLDAGSGSGYMSAELSRLGVETFAVDCGDPALPIHKRDGQGDAVAHVSARFGAVLMTWPPYDLPFAFDIAEAMLPGQMLIYEGEDAGGCCANWSFFETVFDPTQWGHCVDLSAKLNAEHVTFSMHRDQWFVFKKLEKNDAKR